MIKSEDLNFSKIKEKINKAGNLFYQYRAWDMLKTWMERKRT